MLSVLAPGHKYILNDTIWDRSRRVPIRGSRSPQEWQEMVAMTLTSPWSQYRIMGNELHFFPIPAAGNTCAFEYVSKYWVNTSVGGFSGSWTNDDDTTVLDEDIVVNGLVWRWKAAKGLDYAEDFASYERDIMDTMAKDATSPTLRMDGGIDTINPIVITPVGSWGT